MSGEASPELDGASVVLIGSFNPAIVSPSWLVRQGLLRSEEGEQEDSVVSREVTQFSLNWLTLQVTPERFAANTADPSQFATLHELVLGIFHFLEYTPIEQMGINRRMHFPVKDESAWHLLGDRLAPKEPWIDVLRSPHREGGLPGLNSVVVEGLREDSAAKYVRVQVEPSVRIRPGVYVATNEHYEAGGDDAASVLLSQLSQEWQNAHSYAGVVANHLLSLVE